MASSGSKRDSGSMGSVSIRNTHRTAERGGDQSDDDRDILLADPDIEGSEQKKQRKSFRPRTYAYQWAMITCFQLLYSFVNAGMGLFVLPTEAEQLNQDNSSVWVGLYLAICGVAQLICPLAGKFSDRHQSKYGKRRPFIFVGTIFAALSMTFMWISSYNAWPYLYCVALFCCQMSLNVVFSAQSALPADLQDSKETAGTVSGLIAVHNFLGSLLAMAVVIFTRNRPVQIVYGVYIAGILAVGAIVSAAAPEESTEDDEFPPITMVELKRSYLIDLDKDRDFFWVCVGRMFFYISTSVVVFLYYYIRDMIHITAEKDRREHLGELAIGAQLVGAVFALPCSAISNRIGRKPVIYTSCFVMMTTFGFFIAAPKIGPQGSWPLALFAGLLYGAGTGGYLSVDYALALDCLPSSKTPAEAFGLWGVAGFLGSTVGPLIGGTLLAMCNDQATQDGSDGMIKVGGSIGDHHMLPDSYNYLGWTLLMAVDGCLMTLLAAAATSRIEKVE